MKHQDLKIGQMYLYQDTDETCQAVVLKIDNEKKEVTFTDTEEFEWQEPFEDIPNTIIKTL